MPGYEFVGVHRYRRLRAVELPLRPLNVLIGANGCGKSSLLDVFTLLSRGAKGELKAALNDAGGLASTLSAVGAEAATSLRFELRRAPLGASPWCYTLMLQQSGAGYAIEIEELAEADQKHFTSLAGRVRYWDSAASRFLPPAGDYDPLETALGQSPKDCGAGFRKALASTAHYHTLDVGPRAAIRLPQPLREARLPGANGEDLIACLYWMRETDPDRFELLEDTLRAGFPDFERLTFPPVATGLATLQWKERCLQHPLNPHQLSEGTLRFLWLTTLLCSRELPEVTLLDEPEVSLHPELLAILVDCLTEASRRTQLIVATHSERLVRFLQPSDVVVVDQSEGAAVFQRASDLDLDEWLKEYSLDQLWQHGRIGGRP